MNIKLETFYRDEIRARNEQIVALKSRVKELEAQILVVVNTDTKCYEENTALQARVEKLEVQLEAERAGHDRYRELTRSNLAETKWKKENARLVAERDELKITLEWRNIDIERLRKVVDAARESLNTIAAWDFHCDGPQAASQSPSMRLARKALRELDGEKKCEHIYKIDGIHSNEYCEKCFEPKRDGCLRGSIEGELVYGCVRRKRT